MRRVSAIAGHAAYRSEDRQKPKDLRLVFCSLNDVKTIFPQGSRLAGKGDLQSKSADPHLRKFLAEPIRLDGTTKTGCAI